MAELEVTEEFIATVMRHANEDFDNRQLQKRMEKLFSRLREGRNYVNPKEYLDCADYFLDEDGAELARDRKSFRVMGRLEIIRVAWRDESKLMTVAALAKHTGKSKSQMQRLLNSADIPFKFKSGKRYYDFNVLERLRDDTAA